MEKTILFKLTAGTSIDFRAVSEITPANEMGRTRLKELMTKNRDFINLCAHKTDENGKRRECTIDEALDQIKSVVILHNGRMYGVGFLPDKITENIVNTIIAAEKSNLPFYCPKTKKETRSTDKNKKE